MARDKYVIEMDEYFSQERFSKCVDASSLDAILSKEEIAAIEADMANLDYSDVASVKKVTDQHQEKKDALAKVYADWEGITEQLC
jgi:hypothetical protein